MLTQQHNALTVASIAAAEQQNMPLISQCMLCSQVSELIERFAEGSAEREAPVHALKKALQLVATDCHASYAR